MAFLVLLSGVFSEEVILKVVVDFIASQVEFG